MASSPQTNFILDRYRVVGQAGRGGYGQVLEAYDTRLKRPVAIKVIELSPAEVAQAQLLAMEARVQNELGDGEYSARSDASARPSPSDGDRYRARAASQSEGHGGRGDSHAKVWLPWEDGPIEGEDALGEEGGSSQAQADEEPDPLPHIGQTATFEEDRYAALAEADLTKTDPLGSKAASPRAYSTEMYQPGMFSSTGQPSPRSASIQGSEQVPYNGQDEFDHIPGLEEARTAAQLSDANIVTVYDCEVKGGVAYIIMEYIEGKTLTRILDEIGDDINLDIVAAVLTSIAHALDVAHKQGVLHLDIKPDNVIVNEKGVVKVTDFGLAALMDASGTGTTGGGTIGYMPLEQMREQALDVRTDEWALASLVYEMLAGENPFFANDLPGAERAIETARLVLPSLCWDDMDEGVDDVIFRALDPDPGERYPSVAEFADALEPYLGSVKKGKKALADIVSDKQDDLEEPQLLRAPRLPLVDRVGVTGGAIIARVIAVVAAALLAAIAGMNIHLQPGSAFGIATEMTPLFWGIVAAVMVIAAIKPHVGALVGFATFGIALMGNEGVLTGIVVLAVTIVWWWFLARRNDVYAVCALLQPLGGAFGMAALAPLANGCFLTVKHAIVNALFSVFTALVFAALGSGSLLGWDAMTNFSFRYLPVDQSLGSVLMEPATWLVAASWVAAAFTFSACCSRGTRALDILGAVGAAVLLVVGIALGYVLAPEAGQALPLPTEILGVVVPGVLAVIAAAIDVPDAYRSSYVAEE